MTEEQFLALEPRERDALVAVEVMEEPEPESPPEITGHIGMSMMYTPNGTDSWGLDCVDDEYCWKPFPFTEKIETAWQVVEKMREQPGWDISIDWRCGDLRPYGEEAWEVRICRYDGDNKRIDLGFADDPRSDIPCLAICIAALKAKGVIE